MRKRTGLVIAFTPCYGEPDTVYVLHVDVVGVNRSDDIFLDRRGVG